MARVVLAAVFFIILTTIGASAVNFQGDALGHQYDLSETHNPSGAGFTAGEVVTLDRSNIADAHYADDSSVDVFDENDIEAVEGEDYEWNENNGTFTVLSGGSLVGDADADVNYSFTVPTQQQKNVLTIVSGQLTVASALVYAFAAIIGVTFLKLLAGASP